MDRLPGGVATLIAGAVATVVVVALLVAWAVREPLARAALSDRLAHATGLDVSVAHASRTGDAWDGSGVALSSRTSALRVTVTHATASFAGGVTALALDGAAIAFGPGDVNAVGVALTRLAPAGSADIVLHDASLQFALEPPDASLPPRVVRVRATGTMRVRAGTARFDGSLDVDTSGGAPVTVVARTGDDGAQHFEATDVPLAAFEPFAANAALRPTAGALHDVAVDVANGALRARARLDGAAFALGTSSHALRGLHGLVEIHDGALGTRALAGSLDAVPFDAAGEVDDLGAGVAWLRDGSKDAALLGDLVERIAGEPQLRSVHVDTAARGLAFAQYALATDHGPLAVSILAIDPAESTLHFGTALAEDHIVSGGERTSAMALRTSAVGGVNGDYFDIGRTYQPQGMLLRDGRLVRGPVDRAALAIDAANHVTFAEFHLTGSVTTSRGRFPLTEFNDWPPGQAVLITPDFGRNLRAADGVTFIALQPLDERAGRYRVTSIAPVAGALPVAFGIAIGRDVKVPLPRVGETIGVRYRIDPPLTGAVAAIGGGPILLRDGAWYEDPHAPAPDERNYRWPVVALGRTTNALLLVAVDGRHPERSVGATRPEFATLLQRLGVSDAMALDSGGSVTLVSRSPGNANATVRNVPSDNSAERWISDALFLYSSAPAPRIVPVQGAATPVPETRPTP